MTSEEAISTIEVAIGEVEWNYPLDYAIAFETAIKALKKQMSKKTIPYSVEYEKNFWGETKTVYKCSCCNKDVSRIHNYCPNCGQKTLMGGQINDRRRN